MLEKAPVINEKKEWVCEMCEIGNVWTRKKCRICDDNNPAKVVEG